ncbi:MAG: FtsQ-type POTRA domain-containing protein [bacterium]|nr:FtsQ-type POTRA domain-containing protein [bacterium]
MNVRILFRRSRLMVLGLLTIAVISGISWGIENSFQITHIEVRGSGVSLEIQEERFPDNLLFFPSSSISEDILKDNPLLESVSIQKKFPHTLIITATERRPIARLVGVKQRLLLSDNGIVLGDSFAPSGLPDLLFDLPPVGIGEQISDRNIRLALTFLSLLSHETKVDTISLWEDASLRATYGKTDILIPQISDIKDRAGTLQTLLSGFRIKGTMPARIDLRFDKPVVTF